MIDFALRSVGKIPYYYGGKAYHPGYENNHFGSPSEPDTKGRMLSGLDCSGWINWIYYSVIGMPLSQHGTGSLIPVGADITPAALQPGDLLLLFPVTLFPLCSVSAAIPMQTLMRQYS